MRLQIAEALLKLGKAEAIDEVRAALYPSRSEDMEATALAVQILGQIRDNGSRAQLRNLTSDKYDSGNPMPVEIRLAAAASLARMGDLYAVGLAEQFMFDKTPAIRAQSAAVFGDTRDAKYLPKLATLMSDPDEQVRISSAAATLKITDAPR
jgi:HEAT repeat protein